MTRPLRVEFEGAVYHITSRGNAKKSIFFDDEDRKKFLKILSTVVERFEWICHAYCLMDNHYHLLLETPRPNLSKGMRQLNGVYSQSFNKRHNLVGHVLQGRYKSILVEKEAHLLELTRYVVLNPVRAGLVNSAADWPWSSYRATAGLEPAPEFLHVNWILSQFASTPAKAIEEYRLFVAEGAHDSPWEELKGGIVLGSEEFLGNLEPLLKEKTDDWNILEQHRLAARPKLEEIFAEVKDKKERNRKIVEAVETHKYMQSEVAKFLGIHYSTVSTIIKKTASKEI